MNESDATEQLLTEQIRQGDEAAWRQLIAQYEGRLLAYVQTRLGRRPICEDIVQDTFLGFLTSLPYYDGRRSLESYLFSICAHKLTDYLRREGRRPAIALSALASESSRHADLPDSGRRASSIARSSERLRLEEEALVAVLRDQITYWQHRGEWTKIRCMELLFVRGRANKEVAEMLALSEQQVANYKFDFLARLRTAVRKFGPSRDIFPDLYA
jgi:RNA polymerase sigma-70 factor (ECF subfamily)